MTANLWQVVGASLGGVTRHGGHHPHYVAQGDQIAEEMLTALRDSTHPLTVDEMAHRVGITGELAEDLVGYLASYGRIARNDSRYGLVAWDVTA